jgi:hypothetical protein
MCRAESSIGLDGGGVSDVKSRAEVYRQPKATVLGGYIMGTRVRWLYKVVETVEPLEQKAATYQSIVRRHANLMSILDARSENQ